MTKLRPDLAGLALAGIVAALLTACALAHVDAPSFLAELGLVSLGIGGGAALPRSTDPAASPVAPAAAASPAAAAPVAAAAPAVSYPPVPPAALLTEPATGVFARIATHEP